MQVYFRGKFFGHYFNQPHCFLDSNLNKAEETVTRLETEIEENEKLMEELTEQLKKLEDQAGEIMKSCQEAEVRCCARVNTWLKS